MKLFNFFLLFLLVVKGYGQCPPEDELSFSNQAEVDNFLINYPNCTSFSGDIFVENSWNNINNFNGFQNLESISGYFYINNNLAITNLNGLENLNSVGGRLWIKDNPNLINLNGLENLNLIGEDFVISTNENLESISSLESFDSIGGYLRIEHNTNLLSLSGLENISVIGDYLNIQYNDSLRNLIGLENITTLGGYLFLHNNNNLEIINSLSNLNSIGGNLTVLSNDILQSLSGLENINEIGEHLVINSNDSLQNLIGLENIMTIGTYLWIHNNDNLLNLHGLESLTSIGSYLRIVNNNILQSLSGLENLVSIEEKLQIENNDNLQSLSGLESLNSIGSGDSEILDNDDLTYCSIFAICNDLIAGTETITIDDNAQGCIDNDDVIAQCDALGEINTFFFFDLNENAIRDLGEPLLHNANTTIEPGGFTVYSNGTDGNHKFLEYGTYSVSHDEEELPNWELTNGISTYNTTIDPINNIDTFSFGLRPTTNLSFLYTSCVNGLPRCNEFVTFEVLAINQGTTIIDGTLWFEVDQDILAIEYIDIPDTLDGNNRVGWYFTDLIPGGNTFKREINLQLPGPPEIQIGEFLNFGIQTNYEDINGFHSSVLNVHRLEVLCSYDPNDKLVAPQHYNNYALIDESLVYTIRFQNTGNAEAYDVVIEDLLSEDLDLSTFQYISSSHEHVLSTYINDHLLTFEFKNIFLPDSTSNFDESQGYVMYSISAKDTSSENTIISNTANIFFDLNPAIVTNTTENIMVSTFDLDEDGFEFWNDCDDNNELVNEDALEVPYNGIDDDCNEFTFDDDLDQDGYVFSEDCDDENPAINIDAEEIPNNNIDEDCDGEDGTVAVQELLNLLPQVFPNPTAGLLQIVFPVSSEGTFSLYNVNGTELLKGTLQREIELDLSNHVEGVYLLIVITKEDTWTLRVLKL